MSATVTPKDLEAALPDVATRVRLRGLERPAEVYRDRWGIPHVRAQSEHDAFFAQGFVTAQDRLWHMDFDRRRALGEWASLGGKSGLETGAVGVAGDRLLRRLRVARASKADYEASSPAARSMLDAYSDGVNAFIETTRSLPIEYSILGVRPERWTPWHGIAVYKVRNMLMGTFEAKLWRARVATTLGPERSAGLFKGYQKGHLVTVPPGAEWTGDDLEGFAELEVAARDLDWLGETDAGSNAWVVGGARTASGLPLLAGDSHRGLDTPSVYYQIHLSCPEFSVSGYSLPGVPGAPHFSHTQHCAFGMTHGGADYQDLFIERFREIDGRREYLYKDEWHPAEVTRERIEVRDGEAEEIELTSTRHGPIVAGDPAKGHGLAFSHTGTNSGTPWPNALYEILHAKNADELEDALEEWTEPVNNYMYADVHGNFGYRLRGRIPVRSMANAWRPVPGWTGEHEWQGLIPFAEMPHSRNPAQGYAVTCNQRVTDDSYPHYIGLDFAPEYRARRITERLNAIAPGAATVDDMACVHAERTSIPAGVFREAMRNVQAAPGTASDGLAAVQEWDGRMDREAVGSTVYAATRANVMRAIVGNMLGPLAGRMLGAKGRGAPAHLAQLSSRIVTGLSRNDAAMLPEGQTWTTVIESAFTQAISELTSRLGNDVSTWQWGRVHRTRPRHPLSNLYPEVSALLDPPGVTAHGDGDTPLAGSFALADPFFLTGMSVNRYIHDPSDWNKSRWIVPLGSSGHPGSPHYADQAEMWSNVEYVPQLWDWDEIAMTAETYQELLPGE